jgi:hypothetical protein
MWIVFIHRFMATLGKGTLSTAALIGWFSEL